ncbi:MAG: hypothetical protein AAFN92_12020, partial [Bacteroidota bacterium]
MYPNIAPSIAYHNEQIHSYEKYTLGSEIRFESVSALLADTLFDWFGTKFTAAPVKIEELASECRVTEGNFPLFVALLRVLQRAGYLSETDGYVRKNAYDPAVLQRRVTTLREKGLSTFNEGQWLTNAIGPSFELARVCIPKLPTVLKGEMTGVQLLFSAENYERSIAIYGAHLQEVYYGLIAEAIIKKCHQIWDRDPLRQIRILEIGAGSGKGTIRMLEGLREYADKIHFCFTDIG